MKKVISLLLIITIVCNVFLPVMGLAEDSTDSEIMLTRSDCLVFIMMGIGAKSYQYNILEKWNICDEFEEELFDEQTIKNAKKGCSKLLFSSKVDLAGVAVMYAGIANGECMMGNNDEYVYMNFYRTVKLNEALAFMVRCLEKDKAIGKGLDETFEMAKEKGLIKETDLFYEFPEKNLTLSEFKIIFKRFLKMPRGWYHQLPLTEDYFNYFNYKYDENRSKTYEEMLSEIYTISFVDELLDYDALNFEWNPDIRNGYKKVKNLYGKDYKFDFLVPKIKYAKFPFRLTYEHNGEIKTKEDTITCSWAGHFVVNQDAVICQRWVVDLLNTDQLNGKFEIIDVSDYNERTSDGKRIDSVVFSYGNGAYYMGENINVVEPKVSDFVEIECLDLKNRISYEKISLDDAHDKFGIRLIDWECAPPIENNYE
ncbi:MAG: hypothetical protein E7391_00115 [Ruminococcaceae bacterium]|nr:hypothetical protein [Oscillospiraceae bacterium]